MAENESHILDRLRRDQLISGSQVLLTPLGGGVSSDVFLVENESKRFVLKQALPRLKVAETWQADVSRNRYEYEFLRYLGAIIPEAAPKVFALGNDYFTMEYLGPEYRNWKQLLMSGDCRLLHAAMAAKVLGRLHRSSWGNADLAKRFDTTRNFHQLRTDPYLITAGGRHPDLNRFFEQEVERLESTRECLVHGDYSPKNMLIGNGQLVLLDCEVAWYGDPSFDLAFLINHLLLKALYHAPADKGLEKIIEGLLEAYYVERGERSLKGDFDFRTARLLLMLLLARIDGKSPVEYLSSNFKREFVRGFVKSQLFASTITMDKVVSGWFTDLQARMGQEAP